MKKGAFVGAKFYCPHALADGNYTATILRPFYRDHPGEPVPEENFWTLCASED